VAAAAGGWWQWHRWWAGTGAEQAGGRWAKMELDVGEHGIGFPNLLRSRLDRSK
jgi:hypothetical protein